VTAMSNRKTIKFGPVVRFRVLDGDLRIIQTAAEQQGQTVSAYLRDAAMARALDDLRADTRAQALRKISRPKTAVSGL